MSISLKYLLILIVVPLILTLIWFHNGLILGEGEEGLIFYNPSKNLELSKSTWVEINTGMPNLYWLPRLPILYWTSILVDNFGISPFVIQAGLFYILLLTGTISVFFLTRFFLELGHLSYLISFVAAVFYLLNPFSFSQVWGRNLYPQYFSFALLPLSLLLLAMALKQKNYLYLLLLLIASLIFSWAFGFVTSTLTYWLMLTSYFIWWLFSNKLKKHEIIFGISFMILFLLGWLLVHAFWFLPFITQGNAIFAGNLSNPGENLGTLLGVSRSYPLEIIIRLLHKGYFFDASAFSQIYSTIPFQLISFIPALFVVIGLLKIIKNQELVKFKFLAVVFFLGLIVSLGANPPIGNLFVFIFELVPQLQAFRNPFEKFGLVYALGYASLFAYGLVSFLEKRRFKNLITIGFLFLTCGIYAWPMWTGLILGGPDKKIGVEVPGYYEDLNRWLEKNDPDNYRLIMTPLLPGEAAVFNWGNTSYNGVDPMHFILDRVAVSNGAQIPFYYDFSAGIRNYLQRENLVPTFSLLRSNLLINRTDMVNVSEGDKDQYQTLNSKIYPPVGFENELKTLCKKEFADSKIDKGIWITCKLPVNEGDLTDIKYLHLKIKTSEKAFLEVVLRDNQDKRIRWDGRSSAEYSTDKSDWTYLTLPLSTPTENNPEIDFSDISILEVMAHPKDEVLKSIIEINIEEVKLDPGVEKQLNEFKEIVRFGKLSVSEVINFNPPPEFGNLTTVNIVKDFPQLFTETNRKRDLTNKEGFVLTSQNNQKNLQGLEKKSSVEVVSNQKISSTRYWLELSHDQSDTFVILSKTFNPQWKVIAGVNKDKLSGNFFDDLDLLKMAFLPEENHYVVNGYANLWVIKGDQKQLAVVFLPQLYADMGLKVSLASISLLVILIVIFSLRRVFKS